MGGEFADQLADGELRNGNPRSVQEVEAVAAEAGASPGQVALAWLLTRGDDIVPIPGTKRVTPPGRERRRHRPRRRTRPGIDALGRRPVLPGQSRSATLRLDPR
ncbi:hypothetical protein [Actinocorallia longicatena]|uniref:Aldo/keto reductase family protein n=1 Tax=Actinocorallia longicatena TaxID=111803 RepID=A0ABP6QDF6_9ACTN